VVEVPIGSEGAHSSATGHRGLDSIASALSDMRELFDPFPACPSPKVRICRKHWISRLPPNIVGEVMSGLIACISAFFSAFSRHRDLALENLALRQQLAIFKRRHPHPSLRPTDRLF
jgi:hypothetical protein